MGDYVMGKVEILALALKHTDAGVVLSGSADWCEPRKFDCPNCGEIGADGVRQVTRDDCCVEVCVACGATVNERLPF